MNKIKDPLILGLLAGFGANIVKEIVAETSIRSGFSKWSCRRIIPHILLSKKDANTWKGSLLGTATDFSVAGLTGIITAYTLAYTGKDYGTIKGILVSNGLLDQVFNYFARIIPEVQKDANSNLLCRGIHTLFGIITVSIIMKMGSPLIFRSKRFDDMHYYEHTPRTRTAFPSYKSEI